MKKENIKKSLLWLEKFKNNEEYNHLRFKTVKTKIDIEIDFEIDKEFLDFVDKETFLKIEDDRIPLFLGTQFGVIPSYDIKEIAYKNRIIAILGKSLLSGSVAGLRLFKLSKNVAGKSIEISREEIINFENQ